MRKGRPKPPFHRLRRRTRLLLLFPRIVLRVDVVNSPRPGTVELDHRVFIGEEIVSRAWQQREETASRQNLSLATIGSRSHAQTSRPGDHSDDLRFGMGMRSNVIVFRQFQSKGKHAFFARIAVEHRRLRLRRDGWRRRSPFDVLWCDQFVLAHLTDGAIRQRRKSKYRHRSNVEKVTPIHRVPPSIPADSMPVASTRILVPRWRQLAEDRRTRLITKETPCLRAHQGGMQCPVRGQSRRFNRAPITSGLPLPAQPVDATLYLKGEMECA